MALLFYLEKGLLFLQIWKDPAGALIHTDRLYSIIFFGSAFSIYAMRLRTIAQFLDRLHLKPAQTLAVSFALLIFFGALFLSLPQMVVDPSRVSFIDALFMATSASTVTGLGLFPVSEFYRMSGQWVLLLLIQFGGLGIMTFGALFTLVSKRDLRLSDEVALQGILETESIGNVRREISGIFIMTLTVSGSVFGRKSPDYSRRTRLSGPPKSGELSPLWIRPARLEADLSLENGPHDLGGTAGGGDDRSFSS